MKNSVYMTWAKYHATARYNLANSGILGCTMADVALTLDDLQINGPNHEGYAPLKELIAQTYGVTPEQVVTSQGTSMANFLAMATIIERGDEVLIEHPAYDPLLSAAEYLGAKIKRFHRKPENGWQPDLNELRDAINERTKLIVLTSPHNPSGIAVESEALRLIGSFARRMGAYVLVDEVYRDIHFDQALPCAATRSPLFITTSSLTKCYGLSGLRCGWILCEPPLAERMRRLNDLFGAVGSMPSDALAVAAFKQLPQLISRTRSIIEPNQTLIKNFLAAHADLLDCVVPDQPAMTVFPRLCHESDSTALHDRLRAADTSIVPGRFFEMPQHFRLGFAVKTDDVATGLRHLSHALRQVAAAV
jgi:hypothetical protein